MCATGNPIGAKDGFACGLVDRLIEDDLIPHAVGYAEEVRDVRPLPKSSEREYKINECDPSVFEDFRKENARKFRGFDAPDANIRAVEFACKKPYAEGVIEERKLFMELMSGVQSRAQQYFFFAERKAAKIESLPEGTQPRTIQKVGVIGAGTMGGGISMNFLSAGIPVTIVEMNQEALDRGVGRDAQELRSDRRQGPDDRRAGREGDGPADADARLRGAGRLRPHHRGGVRADGREEGYLHPARQDGEAGRDPRVQHVLPQHRRDRRGDVAAAGRGRHALLLAGQRDEAAGGRARREDGAGRAGHGHGPVEEDPESRGGRGRLPRLHRQPHADAAAGRGDQAPARRRDAGADRQGPRRVRNADGPVPDGRPRRRRHRLAPRPEPDREYPRRALRDRPLGPEEGRGLLRL